MQCRDRTSNALLDQSRFVVGVTTLYAYDKILNHNPAFPVAAKTLAESFQQPPQFASAVPYAGKACNVDSDCNPNAADSTVGCAAAGRCAQLACASDGVCVQLKPACNKDVPGSCDPYYVGIELAASSFLLTGLDGTPIINPLKSLWIDCYYNAGAWIDDPNQALDPPDVSDATHLQLVVSNSLTEMTGCGGGWQAPTQPTDQARVWVVIRDDRGGIAWLEKRAIVRNSQTP